MTRFGYVVATTLTAEILSALFIGVASVAPRPRLTWNASASAAIGLYRVLRKDTPVIGDLVLVTPPDALATYLSQRRYLPVGVPLLKHVAATGGMKVCRMGLTVTVDGRPAARARLTDRLGRALPIWRGCRTLESGEIFLLNAAPDSMDGRYFGVMSAGGMLGEALPLLTRDAPGMPLHWHGWNPSSASQKPSKGTM